MQREVSRESKKIGCEARAEVIEILKLVSPVVSTETPMSIHNLYAK